MSDVLELTCELIERPSVTPDDAGCQEVIAERLENLGFTIESMPFGDVTNLWARLGNVAPVVAFAGHTDVVPPGAIDDWRSDPFQPDIRDGRLYGRGAADMKASLAAMVVACERFLTSRGRGSLGPLPGSIAFLLTSDEEGPAVDGTRRVVERLGERGEQIDHCIVGEPSSAERLGDTVKIGRRGSLNGHLTVRGVQGHVAYPERADNPIHRLAGALAALTSEQWDRGNGHFPPTSLQVSNINAGTGADNVIPGVLDMAFNLRFSTESRVEDLKARVQGILDRHGLSYDLRWRLSGVPFLTEPGALVSAAEQSIVEATGVTPQLATSGGTSDGRFIAPTGAQVVEFGPVNRSIHQIDEHVAVADLEPLAAVYQGLLGRLLAGR